MICRVVVAKGIFFYHSLITITFMHSLIRKYNLSRPIQSSSYSAIAIHSILAFVLLRAISKVKNWKKKQQTNNHCANYVNSSKCTLLEPEWQLQVILS